MLPMRLCFECGQTTESRYCERDGLMTFVPDLLPPSLELKVDQIVDGRYRIERKIARGGMGEIYQAVQVCTGATVAIKTLIVPAEARRFYHEARATCGLAHPNIIQIFDYGQTEEGVFYLAMELLSGESLGRRLKAQPILPAERAGDIALQVLSGLMAAHARDLVHRDLTPQNLFLHRLPIQPMKDEEDHELVKILDFGIAKIPTVALTRDGQTMGTAAYMSPERCCSDRPVDARSDLYSLGVILYECLTGGPPFDSATGVEVMLRHVRDPIPDLLDKARTPVSPAFAAVVMGALRKDPDERFSDARAMRHALQKALEQGPPRGRGAETWPEYGRGEPIVDAPPAPRSTLLPLFAVVALGFLLILIGARLGASHRHGRLQKQCEEAAEPTSRRAAACGKLCDGGSGRHCLIAGDLLLGGGPAASAAADSPAASRAYQSACDHGEIAACGRLAFQIEGRDRTGAAALYRRACPDATNSEGNAGDPRSCAALGRMLAYGDGIPADELSGALLLRRACQGGSGLGCYHLGELYRLGRGVSRDDVRAAVAYGQACLQGQTPACYQLGILHDTGKGVPRDRLRAAAYFQQACGARHAQSCTSLGMFYNEGKGIPRDFARAAAYFQQACDGGDPPGCSYLGDMYVNGRGLRRDPGKGFDLLRKACRGGHPWACFYLRDAGQYP